MAGQKFTTPGMSATFASSDMGGIVSIGLPERTKGAAESTDNDSAGDREHLPGLRDGGTVAVEYRIIDGDAGQAAIETNYDADNAREEMVITFPAKATDDSTTVTYTFDCFVTDPANADFPQADDQTATATATFKVSGAVTKATA